MSNRRLVLGIFIAVVGLVIFLQQNYFAHTVLGANVPEQQELLRLGIIPTSGDQASEQLVKSNDYKKLAVAVFGGGVFIIGAVLAVAGASSRRTDSEPPR